MVLKMSCNITEQDLVQFERQIIELKTDIKILKQTIIDRDNINIDIPKRLKALENNAYKNATTET